MYSLKYSLEKNRIYITIVGVIKGNEVDKYRAELKDMIDMTHMDFTICANMIYAHKCMFDSSEKFQDIREYAKEKKLLAAVSVVSDDIFIAHKRSPFPGITNISTSFNQAEEYLNSRYRKDDANNV